MIDFYRIVTEAQETEEEFIFTTIQPFCEDVTKRKISKAELVKLLSQPQRKRGKWIRLDSMDERYDELRCPFCHKDFTVDAYRMCDIGFTAEDLKFCPNCGADMRGADDEID